MCYTVIIKKDSQIFYSKEFNSIHNADSFIEDFYYTTVQLLEGIGREYPIFIKDHPSSTIGSPRFYVKDNKIYEHIKESFFLSSAHIYKKIFSVSLHRNGNRSFGTNISYPTLSHRPEGFDICIDSLEHIFANNVDNMDKMDEMGEMSDMDDMVI